MQQAKKLVLRIHDHGLPERKTFLCPYLLTKFLLIPVCLLIGWVGGQVDG
jgi:hypothetical protein